MNAVALITFENPYHFLLWLALIAVGIWSVFNLYRKVFRYAGRRLSLVLVLLRTIGLLALILALAKPAWISHIIDRGRCAVILDNSRSMSLLTSTGKSRYELAQEAVDLLRLEIENKRHGPEMQMELFDINGSAFPGDPPDEATVNRTDLFRAISQTASRLRSKPLAQIVLISDGADNSGRNDYALLRESRVPVHTIGFKEPPRAIDFDMAIKQVHAPGRVIVKNNVKVDVLISKNSGPGMDATLSIKRGTILLHSEEISLGFDKQEKLVSIKFSPADVGNFVLTAALTSNEKEVNMANNLRQFPLQVDPEPILVFYIEGVLRHEFKFIKNRMEDDPDISIVTYIRRTNPNLLTTTLDEHIITADRLEKFEIVILGDVDSSFLRPAEYQALIEWIDKGNALLLLGGYDSFGPKGLRQSPLASVLPAVFAAQEPFQSEKPFTIKLTEEGRQHPIFNISGNRAKDMELWKASPPLLGMSLVERSKQSAEVLAVNPEIQINNKPAPVVMVQRYGSGRTMMLCVDTTWQWSRIARIAEQPDTLFSRFWSQTIRWLAGREMMEERPLLMLSIEQSDFEVGKPVGIIATRQATQGEDLSKTTIKVEFMQEGGTPTLVTMETNSKDPDAFKGEAYPTVSGRYLVIATLLQDEKPIANQQTSFTIFGADFELARASVNRENMRSISAATGGIYYDIEDTASLADKLERIEQRKLIQRRIELWNSPFLLALFLLAISAEWLLRRRYLSI